MSNWIPTNYQRFVKRRVYDYNPKKGRVVHILQQKWIGKDVDSTGYEYDIDEWRDIPVVEEE